MFEWRPDTSTEGIATQVKTPARRAALGRLISDLFATVTLHRCYPVVPTSRYVSAHPWENAVELGDEIKWRKVPVNLHWGP